MIDLNKIVNETLVNLEEEKFVEKVVKERLEKTITGIVDDVFREYGDFGKSLKDYIENNLNVNLERLGLEGYNTLALAAIKEQLDQTITVQGIEKLKKSTEEMLSDVKKSYNLSELIETLKNKSTIEEREYDDKITLFIEKDGSFTHIYMDDEEKDHKYDCDYQININRDKPYSIKLKGDEINTKKILGGFYGLDRLLFKIYSTGANIELDYGDDPEDYDIYYYDN
ncbi:hypothetical protein QTH05_06845 [Clostridium perfringens]|nr:hypothetical protein [Clostridium perfringens]